MSKKKEDCAKIEESSEKRSAESVGDVDSVGAEKKDSSGEAQAPNNAKPQDLKTSKPQTPSNPAEPDWKSLYAITLADFDNYKKRAARDREDVYRYAESDILKDILPVVDNLALALEHAKDKENEFVKGVQLVYDGLLKALADHGAKPMEDLVGKELDPNFHEAIATLPDEKIEEGKISNVAKVGWLLNDKLLRAAQVVVSAGKPA